MKYEDIINRIIEIIKLSEQKKNELESIGLFDSSDFSEYYSYYIYKDYDKEFERLKNQELTYYLLKTDKYAGLKNQILIKECNERINRYNEDVFAYQELIDIINKCNGKDASQLTYINGYFVCNEDALKFKQLCKTYNIGYSKDVVLNKQETVEVVQNSINQIQEQKLRIEGFLNKAKKDFNKNNNGSLDITLTSSKHKELIFLALTGKLKPTDISRLKNVMNGSEFGELIEELRKFNVFSNEEISIVISNSMVKEEDINDIDELVSYFVTCEDLDIDNLKQLIPTIGLDNYCYLIDKLFIYKKISSEDYMDYLKDNMDNSKKR